MGSLANIDNRLIFVTAEEVPLRPSKFFYAPEFFHLSENGTFIEPWDHWCLVAEIHSIPTQIIQKDGILLCIDVVDRAMELLRLNVRLENTENVGAAMSMLQQGSTVAVLDPVYTLTASGTSKQIEASIKEVNVSNPPKAQWRSSLSQALELSLADTMLLCCKLRVESRISVHLQLHIRCRVCRDLEGPMLACDCGRYRFCSTVGH